MGIATLDAKAFTSKMNNFKRTISEAAKDVPHSTFQPLRSWPAVDHPEQQRLDSYRAISSTQKPGSRQA